MLQRYYSRLAKVGATVKFGCATNLVEEEIDWSRLGTRGSRHRDIYVPYRGLVDLGLTPKFSVLDRNQSFTLIIHNVTEDDTATYRCVEDSGLGNERKYRLTVQGAVYAFLHSCVCV